MIDTAPKTELSPGQQRALRALLNSTSISAAAEEAGLARNTVQRYLADPTFAQAYREQRGLALQETVAGLQRAGGEAVDALREALGAHDEDVRVRAARSILDYLFKGVELERRVRELEDVIARLDELEGQYAAPDWRRSA